MTEPKTVSNFAKEYQQIYLELTQLRSAYAIVVEQRDHALRNEKMVKEALFKYEQASLLIIEGNKNNGKPWTEY